MSGDWADFSSNNPLPDLKQYKASGASLIGVKATEGVTYAWADGVRVANTARGIGLTVISYHFATPGVDGARQARFFLANSDPKDVPCLDLEGNGWAPGEASQVCALFCHVVEAARGPGVLYTGGPFAEEHHLGCPPKWRWWVPAYPTLPPAPPGFPEPWAHQYTDRGRLPGMHAPGDVSRLLTSTSPARPPVPPVIGAALMAGTAALAQVHGQPEVWVVALTPKPVRWHCDRPTLDLIGQLFELTVQDVNAPKAQALLALEEIQ